MKPQAQYSPKERIERPTCDIEIPEIQQIPGLGLVVHARAWKDTGIGRKQVAFGKSRDVDLERFIIPQPRILVPDPNGDIVRVRSENVELGIPTTTRRFRKDPEEALLQVIEHNLSVMQNIHTDEKIVRGKRGNTTSTFYPTLDGYARYNSTGVSWSTIRAANGTQSGSADASMFVQFSGGASPTLFDLMSRSFFVFDTSAIGSDTVSSATFSSWFTIQLNEFTSTEGVSLVEGVLGNEASIATTDYQGTRDTVTKLASDIDDMTTITTGAYTDWSLNGSGISAIDTAANTILSLRMKSDVDNTTPTAAVGSRESAVGVSTVDTTGTTQDPKLVVEHAAGGGGSTFVPRVMFY